MGTALPQSSRSGFPWRKAGGGLALLLVLGSVPAMWWGTRYALYGRAAAHLDEERNAARQEGLPLTPNELRATLPKVADADNAAPLYRSLLPESGGPRIDSGPVEKWLQQRGKQKTDGTSLPAPITPEVRACFVALAPRLAVAEKASRLPGCDWNRHWEDGARITFPEMALSRSLVRQFSARALMRADDGDLAGAFADIETSARISSHQGADPTLIALLVQTACEAITDRTFVQAVLTRPDDPHTVILARSAEATFHPLTTEDFVHALNGETMMYRVAVDEYRHDPAAFLRAYNSPPEQGQNSKYAPSLPTGPPKMLADAWEATGIAHLRALHTAMKQPSGDDPLAWYNALAKISAQAEMQRKRPGHEFLDMLFPIYSPAARRLIDDAARDRLRRTLIALVIARQSSETHTWPASLPAPPDSIPAERTDPFTGKAFHYTTTDGGRSFLLYSVGDNAQDDSGSTGKSTRNSSRTDDIAIRFP